MTILYSGFDIHMITAKTGAGNTKVIIIFNVFTGFFRAISIPDEKAETLAKTLMNEWIFFFGSIEKLPSDRDRIGIGFIVSNFGVRFSIKRLTTYPLHPQDKEGVIR